MTNWLDYFKKKVANQRELDINQPVPVGDPMQDLRAPLPEQQQQSPTNRRRWDTYNLNERDRRWVMTRERRA